MVQGGWRDSRTIFEPYRGNLRERQVASLEAALGEPKKDSETNRDVPGYALITYDRPSLSLSGKPWTSGRACDEGGTAVRPARTSGPSCGN